MSTSLFKKAIGTLSVVLLCALSSCLIDFGGDDYGRIQGIVTDANTGEPIQGVNITLSPTGQSAVTGSDGRYEMSYIHAGQYTVQAVKTGYESNTKSIVVTEDNVAVGDMQLTRMVTGFRLNVEYLDFGANFSQLQFKIINASESLPMSWEIVESLNWLETTPSTGNLQGGQETTVNVTIDRSLIQQSTTANITVRSADQTIVLPINVSVSGNNGPHLQLSETSLDFGTSANSLTFYVMNTGPSNTSLNWICSNINVSWLTLTPTSGNTAGGQSTQVIATIDRTQISGVVSTSVTISGAGTSSTISITASTSGTGTAILQLSEGSLDFGETAITKTFQVRNVGSEGTILSWSINPVTVDWLSVTPTNGTTNAGSGSLVTAIIDRDKIHGPVSTTLTVVGTNNSANLNVSVAYVDNTLVVADGLFCFFNFDGSEIVDYYGNYSGINAGVAFSTDTPSGEGQSIVFDGNSFVMVQDNILPSTDQFSFNVWIKTGKNDQYLIGSDRAEENYYFKFNNNSCLNYISRYTYTDAFVTSSLSSILNNTWHMLTVVINGNLAMIYVDGVLFETKTSDYLRWSSDLNATFLGTTSSSTKKFTGKMDNFRSYSRALTANEVQALYNAKQ